MGRRPPRPLIVPVFIPHAGCPHQCIFCNQHTITGTPEILRPDAIRKTIECFLTYRKDRAFAEIAFFGGNFLGLGEPEIESLLDIAASYARSGQIDGIRFSTRPDTVTPDRLDLITDYPVTTIELGVQSMNEEVLVSARRGHTTADTVKAAGLIRDRKYRLGLQMMAGLPGDTPEKAVANAHALAALKPGFVRIYPTLVIQGSPLARQYREGRYTPLTLDQTVALVKNLCRIFDLNHIPIARIGLQASKELNDAAQVLAGPYHPALGHMVRSAMLLDAAVLQLKAKSTLCGAVTLTVHPRSLSRMQGLNKQNLEILKCDFQIRDLCLRTDPTLKDGEVRVEP